MRNAALLSLFALVLVIGPTGLGEYQVPVRYVAAAIVAGYILGSLRGRSGHYEE